jgi:hypothetical protein
MIKMEQLIVVNSKNCLMILLDRVLLKKNRFSLLSLIGNMHLFLRCKKFLQNIIKEDLNKLSALWMAMDLLAYQSINS